VGPVPPFEWRCHFHGVDISTLYGKLCQLAHPFRPPLYVTAQVVIQGPKHHTGDGTVASVLPSPNTRSSPSVGAKPRKCIKREIQSAGDCSWVVKQAMRSESEARGPRPT